MFGVEASLLLFFAKNIKILLEIEIKLQLNCKLRYNFFIFEDKILRFYKFLYEYANTVAEERQ